MLNPHSAVNPNQPAKFILDDSVQRIPVELGITFGVIVNSLNACHIKGQQTFLSDNRTIWVK